MLPVDVIEPVIEPLASEPERSLLEWVDYFIIAGSLVVANIVNILVWRGRGRD